MSNVEATAEVFLTAFHALPPSEREAILVKLLQEEEAEDLVDSRIAHTRRDEPSRSLDDYLQDRKAQ